MAKQNSVKGQAVYKDAVIIGTGFGGLGMAIKLKEAGLNDFAILEKGQDVGGCWRENTYPGAACDVPSLLYSFSFEAKSDWTRHFAPQNEIHGYLQHCAKKYQLTQHIQFNTEVSEACFDEEKGLWNITSISGEKWQSRVFISACGQLSQPAMPNLKGMENFTGKVMHSARWDHDYNLQGKTVAVIGTGASAIQFVPEVAKQVNHMTVFQRSAPFIIPKPDRAYTGLTHSLLKNLPLFQKLSRLSVYIKHEIRLLGFTWLQAMMPLAEAQAKRYMKKTIKDPVLREKLTPDYRIGCKRILISNNYYKAFTQANVALETNGISHIESDGVVLKNGDKVEVDAIIYGTGFKATDFLSPIKVKGLYNKNLNEQWHKGAEAYLGITVKDFPNFYMLYGPNTNLGHNSIVYMLESQIRYTLKSIKLLNNKGIKYLNIRQNKHDSFNEKIQQQVKKTVWEKGCESWYKTDEGKNTVNWPDFTFKYRHKTRNVNLSDYHVVKKAS